jgi:carboxymethylenebutenolidase
MMSRRVAIPTPEGRMGGHLAKPEGAGPWPAVVVAMEAFGLNRHIADVADRIAAEGYVTLAPDFYYREADGLADYADLPKAIGLMRKLDDARILADVQAALDFLRGSPEVRGDRIGMTGFCMGGRITFLAACRLSIQAAAPFYGGRIAGLLGGAAGISCPMVLFFGEQDAFLPLAEVDEIRARLAEVGASAEVVVYPGADHGFFCEERPSYQEAAARDSWRRLRDLFATHLAG